MSRTRFALLSCCIALALGCKKKPPEEAPVYEAEPVAKPARADVPAPVSEMAANFSKVFFDFDQASLDSESKAALDENARIMTEHADLKLEIQGHADERGTTDYNLALGQRRANAVYKYMGSKGVANSRIKIVSYGEERPVDHGHSEVAWSRNRRAEFVITWKGDANVQGTTEN